MTGVQTCALPILVISKFAEQQKTFTGLKLAGPTGKGDLEGSAHIGPSRPKLKLGQRGGALARRGNITGRPDLTDAINAVAAALIVSFLKRGMSDAGELARSTPKKQEPWRGRDAEDAAAA